MLYYSKQQSPFLIRRFQESDAAALEVYLNQLSNATQQRFAPHGFTKGDIIEQLVLHPYNEGYLALLPNDTTVIAYTLLRKGFLLHDQARLEGYGIVLDHLKDATIAPSVADDWQGTGVGKQVFQFIADKIMQEGYNRIILWGGVQASNATAVLFYRSLGFTTLGHFDYQGANLDMVLPLPSNT